jgi:hypothetical protein
MKCNCGSIRFAPPSVRMTSLEAVERITFTAVGAWNGVPPGKMKMCRASAGPPRRQTVIHFYPGFRCVPPWAIFGLGLFSDVPCGNLRPRVNLLMDGTNFQRRSFVPLAPVRISQDDECNVGQVCPFAIRVSSPASSRMGIFSSCALVSFDPTSSPATT